MTLKDGQKSVRLTRGCVLQAKGLAEEEILRVKRRERVRRGLVWLGLQGGGCLGMRLERWESLGGLRY